MMLHILIVKILQKKTIADKLLKNRAFNIAKDPKHDGYQRGLASMVYTFFGKKSAGSGAKHVNTKITPQNQQLAEELHKPIIKILKKERDTQHLKIIFGVLI